MDQHAGHTHLPDHDSDPAQTPGDGWVSEGGASHLGPATHTQSSQAADSGGTGDVDTEERDADSA